MAEVGGVSEERVADLTFKARALAQAHPLSVTASAYRTQLIDLERETQPLPEFADWAATAFLVGYCIRRVEEADTGWRQQLGTVPNCPLSFDALGEVAGQFSADIRSGRAAGDPLLPSSLVEALLDKVISTEVDKRADHWKPQISEQDWSQYEEYVAWWVIHGYALRAAEAHEASGIST